MDLVAAAASGDRKAALEALRDVLAVSILAADPDKRSSLSAQLTVVLAQIEALQPKAKAGDPVDEIAKRRSARGAGSAKSQRRPTADEG